MVLAADRAAAGYGIGEAPESGVANNFLQNGFQQKSWAICCCWFSKSVCFIVAIPSLRYSVNHIGNIQAKDRTGHPSESVERRRSRRVKYV